LDPIKLRSKHGPEYKIQNRFVRYLEDRGWLVERMIGNMYQFGIPDLFVSHPKYGQRWIDIKNAGEYDFTTRQIQKWPVWEAHGVGIWIITGDEDYEKLKGPPNWRNYWKTRYGDLPTKEELIHDLESNA